jgi:dUTP pyrophosphatase
MIIEYAMTHDNVSPPMRANPSDAGLDIHYSPVDKAETMTINPNASALLSTGLRFGVPHGYMLEVKNRSSVAAKRQLLVGACVIDAGYDGEVFVNLHNVGSVPQELNPGDKIAQIVMTPVVNFKAYCRHDGELYKYPISMSDRGTGSLGSTDKIDAELSDAYQDYNYT